MKRFILASASPRRKEILKNAGYKFEILKSDKEIYSSDISPKDLAVKNALIKARDVFERIEDKSALVLGADTVVELDGEIFGKPENAEDAIRTLKKLSGKTHLVITGYALVTGSSSESGYAVTEVTFNDLSDELICEYVREGSCMDKAGAYGIQDGYGLVKGYVGDYDNVVGLPISAIGKRIGELLK